MQIFQKAECNAIEKTRQRILCFIISLGIAGELGLITLDVLNEGDFTNNLLVLGFQLAAGLALLTRRTTAAAYLAFAPFAFDFLRVVSEDGLQTHALPLLFLLVVEGVYFFPTLHAIGFIGLLMLGVNGAALYIYPSDDVQGTIRLLMITNIIVVGITTIFTIVFLSMKRYFSRLRSQNEHLDELVKERTQDLEVERRRSEALLHSILPEKIVGRIKDGEQAPVDHIENAAVLFADLSGFTRFSRTLEPDELVTVLNNLFSEMDRLADAYGLEKIKTIGDAYMVAAGVPEPSEDSLSRLAEFAIELRSLINRAKPEDSKLGLRIGLHCGPLVAGVIGERKFMYDLWGETVNIASRMESQGVEGQIQVTEQVRVALGDEFNFNHRGPIEVRGLGTLDVWFLDDRKSRDQQDVPATTFTVLPDMVSASAG